MFTRDPDKKAAKERSATAVFSGGTATQNPNKSQSWRHTDTLGVIESEGWTLDDVGYVFEPTGSVSRDKLLSSGQTETITGRIVGIYLFRRDEGQRDRSIQGVVDRNRSGT